VFAVILSIGGLLSWGLSKLVRLSILSGMDRFLGSLFGMCRGVLLFAVAVIVGQYSGFDNDDWWEDSILIPHLEVVADWIKIMAPQGYELLTPDDVADSLPVELPGSLGSKSRKMSE
jgi:membrane protein required for colicin V production